MTTRPTYKKILLPLSMSNYHYFVSSRPGVVVCVVAWYAKGLEFESQHIHWIFSTWMLIDSPFRIIDYKFYSGFNIPAKMLQNKGKHAQQRNSNWGDLVGVIRLRSPLLEQRSWDVMSRRQMCIIICVKISFKYQIIFRYCVLYSHLHINSILHVFSCSYSSYRHRRL